MKTTIKNFENDATASSMFFQIQTPTLLLDREKCLANIRKMVAKAKANGLNFRPHFKTHQSAEIGTWFQQAGVTGIAVSSVTMAEYFAKAGWKDITIAFPVNIREQAAIEALAAEVHLNILIADMASLRLVKEQFHHFKGGVFIKIDVGTGRTGFLPTHSEVLDGALSSIKKSKRLTFKGFLAHAGHSYEARSEAEILKVHRESTEILKQLKEKYKAQFPDLILSTGDTPTCSVAENWEELDEIRPGNFVFYDLMQVQIGACTLEDIAVVLACPVVAKHPERQEIVLYGGGVHLSKDRLVRADELTHFGLPVLLKPGGWESPDGESYVSAISQEHGVIKASATFFEQVAVNDVIGILPVHSCMTVDLMTAYLTFENKWIEKMKR